MPSSHLALTLRPDPAAPSHPARPPPVLGLAPRGAVNVHASLLPRYRGAAPIQWALARVGS